MKITLNHIGGNPATMIEIIVESVGATICEDITNLKRIVDVDFIATLRQIADEPEEHNDKIKYDI